MLVTFRSKAAAEVVMYKEHAKPILDLLNKDVERGVITAAESGSAITRLEFEIAESKRRSELEEAPRDAAEYDGEGDDNEPAEPVSFATRVFPLLEMLRAARRDGRDVMWGV